jgi:hypothetical protein
MSRTLLCVANRVARRTCDLRLALDTELLEKELEIAAHH